VSDAILSSGRGYRYRRAAAADASRRSFEPRDDDDAGTASDTNCERVSFGWRQPYMAVNRRTEPWVGGRPVGRQVTAAAALLPLAREGDGGRSVGGGSLNVLGARPPPAMSRRIQ